MFVQTALLYSYAILHQNIFIYVVYTGSNRYIQLMLYVPIFEAVLGFEPKFISVLCVDPSVP